MIKSKANSAYSITAAQPEEIDWIARLEAEVYSAEDAIPKHILNEWYGRNPDGFSVIRLTGGEKIGHIDVLPLHPTTLQKFIEGSIVERDFRGEDLYSPEDRECIRNLYVESVAIRSLPGRSKAWAAMFLLANFSSVVSRICNPANIDCVYAMAATKLGESFLGHLGFARITGAQQRRDRHDLFSTRLADLEAKTSEISGRRLSGRKHYEYKRTE